MGQSRDEIAVALGQYYTRETGAVARCKFDGATRKYRVKLADGSEIFVAATKARKFVGDRKKGQ